MSPPTGDSTSGKRSTRNRSLPPRYDTDHCARVRLPRGSGDTPKAGSTVLKQTCPMFHAVVLEHQRRIHKREHGWRAAVWLGLERGARLDPHPRLYCRLRLCDIPTMLRPRACQSQEIRRFGSRCLLPQQGRARDRPCDIPRMSTLAETTTVTHFQLGLLPR